MIINGQSHTKFNTHYIQQQQRVVSARRGSSAGSPETTLTPAASGAEERKEKEKENENENESEKNNEMR